MKVFDGFNEAGKVCPVCGNKDDKKSILVPIPESRKGNVCEALQIHLDCIELYAMTKENEIMLYQIFNDKRNNEDDSIDNNKE